MKIQFLFCLSLLCAELTAQDPIFNQYYSNKLLINPAYTGYEPGTTLYSNYKDQWVALGGRSVKFNTQAFAVGTEICKLNSGVGVNYIKNTEGSARLTREKLGLSYGFHTLSSDANDWESFNLGLGVEASYYWQSLDFDRFTFSDQLDPILGNVRPSILNLLGNNEFSQDGFIDLSTGAIFVLGREERGNLLRGALAFHHLTQPKINNDTLPLRFNFQLQYHINIGYGINKHLDYQIVPMININLQPLASPKTQAAFNLVEIGVAVQSIGEDWLGAMGVMGGIYLHNTFVRPEQFTEKLPFQSTNSVSLHGGIAINAPGKSTYRITASYSTDYSGLGARSGGTWEISLVANFAQAQALACGGRNSRIMMRRCKEFQ